MSTWNVQIYLEIGSLHNSLLKLRGGFTELGWIITRKTYKHSVCIEYIWPYEERGRHCSKVALCGTEKNQGTLYSHKKFEKGKKCSFDETFRESSADVVISESLSPAQCKNSGLSTQFVVTH